jgi:hypothetical protein
MLVMLSCVHRDIQLSPAAIVANILLSTGVGFQSEVITGPSWSLSAECYAYFLFPFVIGWLWRRDGRLAALLCFVLMASSLALGDLPSIDRWRALVREVPLFVVGALTYRLFAQAALASLWRGDAMFLAVAGAIVAAFEFDVDERIIVSLFALLCWSGSEIPGSRRRCSMSRRCAGSAKPLFTLYGPDLRGIPRAALGADAARTQPGTPWHPRCHHRLCLHHRHSDVSLHRGALPRPPPRRARPFAPDHRSRLMSRPRRAGQPAGARQARGHEAVTAIVPGSAPRPLLGRKCRRQPRRDRPHEIEV